MLSDTLFQQSPFSTVIYDASGRIVAVNEAFRRLWGVDADAAPPDYSVLTDPQLDALGPRPALERAFGGEAVVLPPIRYDIAQLSTAGAGRSVWTEAHVFPVFDDAGTLTNVVLSHVDVTARMEAEAALSEREARARNLLLLTTALSDAVTSEEVADAVFREGVRAVGADAGSLAIVDESEGVTTLRMVRTSGYDPAVEREYQTIVAVPGRPLSDAIFSGRPVLVGTAAEWDTQYPGYFDQRMKATGYLAFAAAPVMVGRRAVAGINFSFDGERHFDESSRALLETIAHLCAQALDRARAFDAERRERERGEMVLGAITDGFIAMDASLRYTVVNERAAALMDHAPDTLLGRRMYEVFPHTEDTPFARMFEEVLADRVAQTREDYSFALRKWLEVRVFPSRDGGLVLLFQDISLRRQAHDAARFLAEASRVLSSSLDYEMTLQNLAAAAVPGIADFCTIEMIDDPDATAWPPRTRRLALAHQNPARVEWAEQFRDRLPTDWDASNGLAHVLRHGVSEFVPHVTDEMLRAAAKNDEQLELLRGIGLSSIIIVPLISRGRTLGAVTLVMTESQRQYQAADLALAEDLARRAASAIDNASLYLAAVEARQQAELAVEHTYRLQALTGGLAGSLTERDVIDVIVEQGIIAAGASAGLVMLLSPDGSTLNIASSIGYSESAVDRIRSLPVSAPYPMRDVVERGEPLFIASGEEWRARYAEPVWSEASEQAAAFLPLVGSSRLFGVLSIRYAEARRFEKNEQGLMLAMARQCGQALERAHLYDAERAARADAEQANRAKMDFLATMSHELRTPLNAISGYADLLILGVRGSLTPEQQLDVERIQTSQQHLLSLINDVLNFAKLEAGKVDIELEAVAMHDMLRALEPMLVPQLQAKALYLEMTCDAVEISALADADKLRQVLLNLLSNAVKFTPEGGRIELRCGYDAAEVRIAVSDTGIGIPSQDLERIFDPFVQLERRLTNTVPGTGLGLAISRDLTRAMGGDIRVDSTVGGGSTFTVSLPRAP